MKKIILAILAVTVIFVSCKAKETSPGDASVLRVAMTAQPPTLDTHMTVSQVSLTVAKNIFEQLFTLDEEYNPTPELAESVSISPDGLIYTIKIRQGVKFHNGKTLTSEDIVASMNRWLQFSSRARALLGGSVFEKIDDYTVKLTVPRATQDVLLIMSMFQSCASIHPKEIIETAGATGVTEYVGTGPYKLNEWRADQFIHLVKNNEYTAKDDGKSASGFAGKKEAPTPEIIFHFVTDHATRMIGIRTGEYDIAESVPVEYYDELKNNKDIQVLARPSGSLNLFFNTRNGPLQRVEIRQAVLAALNMEEIMTASFVGPDHFTLVPGYMNINQPQWAVKSGANFYNQGNPAKARQMAQAAGYNGQTIVLHTTRDYQEMFAATIVVQEQLRRAGFETEVKNYDFPTFLEVKGDYARWDLFITSNGYALAPPQILPVNPDWAGFNRPEVPVALNAIRSASSASAARTEWEKLQQFMYEYVSSTALGHYNAYLAANVNVKGLIFFDIPVYWNVRVQR